MSFSKICVKEIIEQEKQKDQEFAREWDESRLEYRLLAEFVQLRKKRNITQTELARMTGNKQQVISRIEKRENSPTLRTFCMLINTLGYELQIVEKKQAQI